MCIYRKVRLLNNRKKNKFHRLYSQKPKKYRLNIRPDKEQACSCNTCHHRNNKCFAAHRLKSRCIRARMQGLQYCRQGKIKSNTDTVMCVERTTQIMFAVGDIGSVVAESYAVCCPA